MKKFLTYFLSASMLLVSCSDDFTEIDPVGALSDASLQNATGVDLLLTGAYAVLDGIRNGHGADWHVTGDNWWMDVISDDAHKGSTDGDQPDLLAIETMIINRRKGKECKKKKKKEKEKERKRTRQKSSHTRHENAVLCLHHKKATKNITTMTILIKN